MPKAAVRRRCRTPPVRSPRRSLRARRCDGRHRACARRRRRRRSPRFDDAAPRRRHVHRQRRHHRLSRQRRRRPRRRQPVPEHRADLRRRPEAARAERHRDADQHAPSRRSHRRQPVFRAAGEEIVAQESCLPGTSKVARAGGHRRRSRRSPTSRSAKRGRRRSATRRSGPTTTAPGHTGGDAVIIFEKANVVHMRRPAVQPRPPAHRPAGRRVGRQLDHGRSSKVAKDASTTTPSSSSATARTTRAAAARPTSLYFRDYLTAVVDHARKGIARRTSRRKRSRRSTALQGFEDDQSVNARLTLPFVARHLPTTSSATK